MIFGLKILLLISKKPFKQSFHSHLHSSVNIDFQLRKKSKAKTYKKRTLIHLDRFFVLCLSSVPQKKL